jgi:triacylglycerol lipase
MNVVMVHGFADTGRLFRSMSRELEDRGHSCHAPTLHPRNARLGLPDLSAKLGAYIGENIPRGAPLALVGFSMGVLVVRHYLQEQGGAASARAFFSIAGPHRGTPNAYLFPGLGTRQMRPGSAFLRELDSRGDALGGLPVHTYRTPFDLMVYPPRTTRMAGAAELVVWCPLHSMLPADSTVVGHIAGELDKLDPSAARSARDRVAGIGRNPSV